MTDRLWPKAHLGPCAVQAVGAAVVTQAVGAAVVLGGGIGSSALRLVGGALRQAELLAHLLVAKVLHVSLIQLHLYFAVYRTASTSPYIVFGIRYAACNDVSRNSSTSQLRCHLRMYDKYCNVATGYM